MQPAPHAASGIEHSEPFPAHRHGPLEVPIENPAMHGEDFGKALPLVPKCLLRSLGQRGRRGPRQHARDARDQRELRTAVTAQDRLCSGARRRFAAQRELVRCILGSAPPGRSRLSRGAPAGELGLRLILALMERVGSTTGDFRRAHRHVESHRHSRQDGHWCQGNAVGISAGVADCARWRRFSTIPTAMKTKKNIETCVRCRYAVPTFPCIMA